VKERERERQRENKEGNSGKFWELNKNNIHTWCRCFKKYVEVQQTNQT